MPSCSQPRLGFMPTPTSHVSSAVPPHATPARADFMPSSVLFAALGKLPAGLCLDMTVAGAPASALVHEFAQAGWRGVDLALAGDGPDLEHLLAGTAANQAYWLAVRGSAAPAWRDALVHAGYLFAASDESFHHFVRADQPVLLAQVAERASLAWRSRLQAARGAQALAQREAGQARSALLLAQSNGMAANARATMLQQQVDAIFASTSWRSTKLLRWVSRLRQDPGPALQQLRSVARGALKAVLRILLLRAAARIEHRPALRRRIAALAERHPGLARRVANVMRPGAPLNNAMALALPAAIDPNNFIGPQFKTLLLEQLGRDFPPASR